MTVETENLYGKPVPPGAPNLICLPEPFAIPNVTPTKWEIAIAVSQMPVFEIFSDLKKAYNSVTCEQTMAAYRVGPNTLRILCNYWNHMLMMARQADYFGRPFTATCGLTQGDPLLPTLVNMVVNAIIQA